MKHSFELKSNINDNLQWLRNHQELCDVILLTSGQKIFAHSCVLVAHSPVLAALLQARLAAQNDWSILKPLIITIDEESYSPESYREDTHEKCILEILIAYLYGEVVTVEDSRVDEMIKLSKIFGLSQLFLDQLREEVPASRHQSKKQKCRRKSNLRHHLSCTSKETKWQALARSEYKDNYFGEYLSGVKITGGCKNAKSADENTSLKCSDIGQEMKLKYEENKTEDLGFTADSNRGNECATQTDTKGDLMAYKSNNLGSFSTHDHDKENSFSVADDILIPVEVIILHQKNDMNSDNTESLDDNKASVSEMFAQINSEKHSRKTGRIGISCCVCSATFYRATDLIHHVKAENHFSQICPLCFVQLNEYDEQRMHFLQHDHPFPFFCFCCDARFKSRAALSMHAPKHSSTKPYVCNECGRAFKWRHAAQAHAITHRNHCHLLCDVCGFSMKYMTTFKSHLKRHYDQFFPCPHPGCNFKSFRKTHLNDHIATHTKLRPHQCEVCGHSFSQAKNLRRHMRLHAPASSLLRCAPLSKGECPFSTTRPDKLRSHLNVKHNIIPHGKNSLAAGTVGTSDREGHSEILKAKELDMNENTEAVCSLKSVTFEDTNSERAVSLDPVLSGKCLSSPVTSNIEDLFVRADNGDVSTIHNISTASNCDGILINADSYETFFISDEAGGSDTDENSFNVKQEIDSSMVLMEGTEVDVYSSNENLCLPQSGGSAGEQNLPCNSINQLIGSIPVVMSNSRSVLYRATSSGPDNLDQVSSHLDFSNPTHFDNFTITHSSDVQREGTSNMQLIGYLPQIKATSVEEDHSSSVILEEGDQTKLQSEFESLQSDHYGI